MSDDQSGEFLGFSEVLLAGLQKSRDQVSANGSSHLGVLTGAHTACLACIGSILTRPDREFPASDVQEKLHRASIHSAVVQGIHAIEYCISVGCYVQAATLVRQEVEAVEGTRGIRQGKQKNGVQPRLKALRHLGRCYGQLSSLAHLSTHDLLAHVVSASIGDIDHSFNPGFSRFLFGLHVHALVGIIPDMAELRPYSDAAIFSKDEIWWQSAVCGVLVEEGLMTLKDATD
ncbi:MAG: hypothetical protein WBC90_06085 [Albidovulum sp.]